MTAIWRSISLSPIFNHFTLNIDIQWPRTYVQRVQSFIFKRFKLPMLVVPGITGTHVHSQRPIARAQFCIKLPGTGSSTFTNKTSQLDSYIECDANYLNILFVYNDNDTCNVFILLTFILYRMYVISVITSSNKRYYSI